MFYDRQIRYIDYWRNKDKVGNAGYVKIEVRDGIITFTMRVTGLPPTDSISREIYLTNGVRKVSIGNMVLMEGQGEFVRCFKDAQFMQEVFPYETLSDIRLRLSGERELFCQWEEYPTQETYQFADGAATGNRRRGRFVMDVHNEEPGITIGENHNNVSERSTSLPEELPKTAEKDMALTGAGGEDLSVARVAQDEEAFSMAGAETGSGSFGLARTGADGREENFVQDGETEGAYQEKEAVLNKEKTEKADPKGGDTERIDNVGEGNWNRVEVDETGREEAGESTQRRLPRYEPSAAIAPKLYENKWDQLCFWYPTIHPFQDGRAYLSVCPEDFVILQASYHKIVKNSFLLHGYYQYRHLVLTRVKRKGQNLYYIGVPGNYYEKEKQVAVYFGFVSFECQVEPAKEGDFGYYMMPVQI